MTDTRKQGAMQSGALLRPDWIHLPDELLALVFSKLPAAGVMSKAALACHRWHGIATTSAAVWNQRFGSYTSFALGLVDGWPGQRPWPKLWAALAPKNMLPPLSELRFSYPDRVNSEPAKPFPPGACRAPASPPAAASGLLTAAG